MAVNGGVYTAWICITWALSNAHLMNNWETLVAPDEIHRDEVDC